MKTSERLYAFHEFATIRLGPIFLLLLMLSPATTVASGFRITNQSVGAVGMSGAHVAHTPGPDASYYNPANMSFLPNHWQLETSLTVLHLPKIEYTDDRGSLFNGHSEEELFYLPLVHVATEQFGKLRYGFSLIYPFGLSKQWQQVYPKSYAEEFSLLTVEANPTFAYQATDWFSIGGGLRIVYGKGEVDNAIGPPFSPIVLQRTSEGEDTQLGYNLALALRPKKNWTIAATYRSEVDLGLSGSTNLRATSGSVPLASYTVGNDVEIALPAVLSVATSYTYDRLTVELAWDRTFWSSFDELDFVYDQSLQSTPFAIFDIPLQKNWEDSDAYRIGLIYVWDERWTTTLGFAYDRTPVPAATLGFELPDADALIYCTGLRYKYSPATELGISYMYHRTQSRSIGSADGNTSGIEGRFTEGGAHAVTVGLITTF